MDAWQLKIVERLNNPVCRMSSSGLARLWRHARIRISTERPDSFSADASLPARIRGALGRSLLEDNSDYSRRLFHLLFEDFPYWRQRFPELARPFSLSCHATRSEIEITINLFGFPMSLAPAAAQALSEALLRGIAVAEQSRTRQSLQVKSVEVDRFEGIKPQSFDARWLCLAFRSPISITQGKKTFVTSQNLSEAIGRRLEALDRWQDVRFDSDRLKLEVEAADWSLFERGSYRIGRSSSRQLTQRLINEGSNGMLVGEGRFQELCHAVRVAEVAQLGARIAFGHGSFRAFMAM